MAADFNAGSIEGTLGLDSTPFRAGLTKAKTDAKAFEDNKIEPTLGLDSTAFDAERVKATAEMKELGAQTARPQVDPRGIMTSLAQIGLVQKALNGLNKSKVSGVGMPGLGSGLSGAEGIAGSVAKFALLPAAILSIVAALGPATAAVVAFGGAAAVAFGGAAIALGFFAKLVTSDFKTIQDATKKGLILSGPAGDAQKALKTLGKAWGDFKKATSGPVFGFLADAFNLASKILPKFEPLMKSVGRGMDGVLKVLGKFTQGPLFERFLKSLQQFMSGFLTGLGPALVDFLSMFMNLFIGLQPLISMLGHGLDDAFKASDRFGKSLQHGGISSFVATMKTDLPILGHLVSALFSAFNGLGKSLAPLSGPALTFLTDTLTAIGHLDLAPLAAGLGAVLSAIDPLLGPLSDLLNTFLTPIGKLLSDIADTAITPFAGGLQKALTPALKSLSDILNTIEPVLARFVAAIANLANPTGISFITTALDSLSQVIKPLAKPVSDLVVALESMVDNALSALADVLPGITPLLVGFAGALGGVIEFGAKILSMQGVTDVLLGIVIAVKAFAVAQTALNWAVGIWEGLQAIFASETVIALGMAACAAATWDFSGAMTALGLAFEANPIGLIATGIAAAATALFGLSHFMDKTGQSARDNMASVSAFAATMDKVTGAYTKLTREEATKELIGKDAFKNATMLGISFDTVSAAALGNAKAIAQVNAVTKPAIKAIQDLTQVGQDQWENLKTGQKVNLQQYLALGKQADAADKLSKSINSTAAAAAAGSKQTLTAALANGTYTKSLANIPSSKILKIGTEGVQAAMADILKLATAGTGLTAKQIKILVGLVPGSEAATKAAIARISAAADRAARSREILFHTVVTGSTNATVADLTTGPPPKKHARGTITSGPEMAIIGDNPGGREAVIPLDKYDLPKKGDSARVAAQMAVDNASMLGVLKMMLGVLGQIADPQPVADALSDALSNHTDANTRKLVQMMRTA